MKRREKKWKRTLFLLIPALLLVGVMCLTMALQNMNASRAAEEKRQLEDALRKAAVACFAVEGAYPADLSDLQERWGVQIDEERYTVYYDVFAENLMPDITVLENE